MSVLKIYYDGECIFCSNYVKMLRLKKNFESVELISIRDAPEAFRYFKEAGYNPNVGMIVQHGDQIHHGADAMTYLATITTRSDFFNRLCGSIFARPRLAKALYPAMRIGRAITLMLLGRGVYSPDHGAQLSAEFTSPPAPLRVAWIALILIPAFAIAFLGSIRTGFFPLALNRDDQITLILLAVLGAGLAASAYRRPWIVQNAFARVWSCHTLAILAYVAILCLPALVFDAVFMRRFFFGMLFLPVVAAMWMLYRITGTSDKHSRLARAFPLAFALMAAVPGFFLPPYYQGIAGWIAKPQVSEQISLVGYELTNDQGQTAWVTHTLFSPITQVGRFNTAWDDKPDALGPIENFIMSAYKRAYPLLKQGYMPHQKYLGKLAYPPHTYATNIPEYSRFPPKRIDKIQKVVKTFDTETGELVNKRVLSGADFSERNSN